VDKRKKIMVWIFTWAGLLVLVLYSPLGSPDLYSPNIYYIANQSFITGTEESASFPQMKRSGNSSGGGSQAINLPTMSSYSINNYSVNSSSYSGKSITSSSNYSATALGNNANSSNGNSGGGGGFQQISFNSGSRSRNRNSNQNESMFMSSDLSMLAQNSMINRQSGQSGILQSQTDPGPDPTGDPIPVGDGWIVMLVFAVAYSIFKITFYKK
jgi:hypothetical protein